MINTTLYEGRQIFGYALIAHNSIKTRIFQQGTTANEMLRIYLNQRLQLLEKKQLTNDIKISLSDFKLKWTGTKSEAIEWGYGLFAAKTLNYGNATIKEVMAFVETAFDIELGDYYRTYLSLKNRKKDRTAFFTFIMEQLQKRMDDDL